MTDVAVRVLNVTTNATLVRTDAAHYPSLNAFSERYASVHGYLAVAICLWGIAANVANIVVLTRPTMRSATNTLLMWLAVADLMTMATYLPVAVHFYILRQPGKFPTTHNRFWIYFMLLHVNSAVVFHTVAIWLTISLALFRAFFVCLPSRSITWCSRPRAHITIAAVYASTVVVCIPNYLVTRITERQANGQIMYEFDDSSFAASLNQANYWIQSVLVKLVPCILLTVLTVILLHSMRAAAQRHHRLVAQGRRDESERAREHNRTTRMLLAVVALFLVTELPQGILTMCSVFVADFFDDVYWQLGDILDVTALLNNSINFVLYCTMSKQFRKTFADVFCPGRCRSEWKARGTAARHAGRWMPLRCTKHSNGDTSMEESLR